MGFKSQDNKLAVISVFSGVAGLDLGMSKHRPEGSAVWAN